jgi:serine/threonine protein kinase
MKKTRILNRMRRQPGNITFELPPVTVETSRGDVISTTATAATPLVTAPLHLSVIRTPTNTTQDEPHPVTPRQTATPAGASEEAALPKQQQQHKKKNHRPFPHLTLSAYRRPEEMVRLTSSDPSRILEQEYNLRAPGCRVIGHGAYSTVRSALRLRDNQIVAIKSISKFDAMRARRLRRPGSKHMDEWEIMELLDKNPYTLSLLDLLETDEEIHLVTEFCEGGELFHAIKRKGGTRLSFRRGRFSEPQAANITDQLLQALREMHQHGIVHRDIKPENVFLLRKEEDCADGMVQVKLGDFGVARVHHHHDHDGVAYETASAASSDGESSPSTPGLLLADKVDPPPEGCRRNCGPASDMFSLGVTLYILLCGFPPVFCEHQVQFPEAYWQDISREAKGLLRSMLQQNPGQRISAEDALKNAWVRQQQIPSRGRRGSICANLELVRSHLAKSLESASTAVTTTTSYETRKTITGKRTRRGSIHFTSPKRARRSMEFPLTELYTCQEKRDACAVKDRSNASQSGRDVTEGLAVKVACT